MPNEADGSLAESLRLAASVSLYKLSLLQTETLAQWLGKLLCCQFGTDRLPLISVTPCGNTGWANSVGVR